jgi:hypothetical protein
MSNAEKIMQVLLQGGWHSWEELAAVGGNRYGGRIAELRDAGFKIESRPHKPSGKEYQLFKHSRLMPRESRVKVFIPLKSAELAAGGVLNAVARGAIEAAVNSYHHSKGTTWYGSQAPSP